MNTTPINSTVEVASFGQAPFFNGGTAAELLRVEFDGIVEQPLLTEVANLFEGLWEVRPADALIDLESQPSAQRSEKIAAALDDLAEAVRGAARPPGGI